MVIVFSPHSCRKENEKDHWALNPGVFDVLNNLSLIELMFVSVRIFTFLSTIKALLLFPKRSYDKLNHYT